jgi:hypothetical protein
LVVRTFNIADIQMFFYLLIKARTFYGVEP